MAVLEKPTEEECYLWALLSDPSGLDLAEFCMTDKTQDDNCFRAWPFQWKWWRDESLYQIDSAARSVGKSLSIKLRTMVFPIIHPGEEMLITAPEGNHLDAVTDAVETAFMNCRLIEELISKKRRGGITHRPFHVSFANGSRIMGRIPQITGRGLKGQHPLWLELDEAQDYPDQGWVEIFETIKQETPGAMWRAHGVTRGLRDYFYKFTQPDSGWKIHKITAMHRPGWNDATRESQISKYGSRDHPDYRRNINGEHGDATNPLFVLHRLMACIDREQDSFYNQSEYYNIKITNEMVLDTGDSITPWLSMPATHEKYDRFWLGMDVGYTNDPSVVVIFAEDKKKGESLLKLIGQIKMERISNPHQVEAIMHLLDFYSPIAFSMDKTGNGLPLFQDLQGLIAKTKLEKIKGYNFSQKILVDFDDTIEVDEYREDAVKKAGIMANVLEYASDKLRYMVDNEKMLLPWDKELIAEFQAPTWVHNKAGVDSYGRRKLYSKGGFHTLDATRMAVLGHAQFAIEAMMKTDKQEPVMDIFISDW